MDRRSAFRYGATTALGRRSWSPRPCGSGRSVDADCVAAHPAGRGL